MEARFVGKMSKKIEYQYELDLRDNVMRRWNSRGFFFEKESYCDMVDKIHKIYVEVKLDKPAPAQPLYALGRKGIRDANYIGLVTPDISWFYRAPESSIIVEFAKWISPDFSMSPSSLTKKEWNDRAFEILGDPIIINTYDGPLNLKMSEFFVNGDNLDYIKKCCEKYEIDYMKLIHFYEGVWENKEKISVIDCGYIINESAGKFFENDNQLHLSEHSSEHGYKKIKELHDKALYNSMRVRKEDMLSIRNKFYQFQSIEKRRAGGLFFTKDIMNKKITDIVKKINPTFIIEPYVGGDSLIDSLEEYRGVGNDIQNDIIQTLNKGPNWKFTSLDTIRTSYKDLVKVWSVDENENLLILTNPPFRGSSENRATPTLSEYGTVGYKYGKGDLVIPAIGKLIDFVRSYGKGYLAFFSPLGVFCERFRYIKLFKFLLQDFEFIEGHIFSGKYFDNVYKNKPIAFTVWKYSPNTNTKVDDMLFDYEGENIKLRQVSLLKEGWNCNLKKNDLEDEIAVTDNSCFNVPSPKVYHLNPKKRGGSRVVEKNVKIPLKISVPSELAYSLWTVIIGYNSMIDNPIYIDNAYVHLPDFTRKETMEILAYTVINTLFEELKKNRCEGRIGFSGPYREFSFGGKDLTKGAKYLIDTYGECLIGDKSIINIFDELKREPDETKISIKEYRREIKKEISDRLEKIGYWGYIPISGVIKNESRRSI